MAPGRWDPSRFRSLWEKQQGVLGQGSDLFETPVERIQIPHEATVLEAYFLKPHAGTAQRPTVILNKGSDGSIVSQWSLGGRAPK